MVADKGKRPVERLVGEGPAAWPSNLGLALEEHGHAEGDGRSGSQACEVPPSRRRRARCRGAKSTGQRRWMRWQHTPT